MNRQVVKLLFLLLCFGAFTSLRAGQRELPVFLLELSQQEREECHTGLSGDLSKSPSAVDTVLIEVINFSEGPTAEKLEDFRQFNRQEKKGFKPFILRLPRHLIQPIVEDLRGIVERGEAIVADKKAELFELFAAIVSKALFGDEADFFVFRGSHGSTNLMTRNYQIGDKTPWHTDVANPDFSFNIWVPLMEESAEGILVNEENSLYLEAGKISSTVKGKILAPPEEELTRILAAPVVLLADLDFFEILVFDAKNIGHGAPPMQQPRKSLDLRLLATRRLPTKVAAPASTKFGSWHSDDDFSWSDYLSF